MITRINLTLNLVILSILIGLSACGTTHTNLAQKGMVNVKYTSSDNLQFEHVSIYTNDNGLLITGELHKRDNTRGYIPGHINIEIIDSNGTILATRNTNHYQNGFKSYWAEFAVEIPVDLPSNSTVHIIHNDFLLR